MPRPQPVASRWQSAQRPQKVTSAVWMAKPLVSDGTRHGGSPIDAVDVRDGVAARAHDVVVVVADAVLVERRRAGGLDPAKQPRAVECGEHAVDGLQRGVRQGARDALEDLVGVEVLAGVDGVDHDEPWCGHLEACRTKTGGCRVAYAPGRGVHASS